MGCLLRFYYLNYYLANY